MHQFEDLEQHALLDMLARQTSLYTQMLADNDKGEEFYNCKRFIDLLTAEYESRQARNTIHFQTSRSQHRKI